MKKIFILSTVLLTLFTACKKNTTDTTSNDSTKVILDNQGYDQNRIEYTWKELPKYEKSGNDAIKFYHLADVSSPIVNGQVTSATGLELVDNYAYVTYHIAGDQYGGALEVFDISTPATPTLVSQLKFTDTDLNECTVANGKVYAVGGRDVESSKFKTNDTKGAVLVEVTLSNGRLTNNVRWAALPSYSANSVNIAGAYAFVVAGSTGGGVFVLNTSDLNLVQSDKFDNPKFCDIKNNQLGQGMYVLQGANATIHEYTAGTTTLNKKISHNILSANVPANGKAVIHLEGDELYVCTGNNGLLSYSTSNFSAGPKLSFNSPGSGNANGVHTDDKFVYIANGYEGLIILNKDDKTIHTIFEYKASANFVEEGKGYIFVANGKTGLKIIKRVDPAPVTPVTPTKNACGKNLTDCAAPQRVVMTPVSSNGSYNVNSGQTMILKAGSNGSNTVGGFNNNSTFLYCGNFIVSNHINFNSNSYTEIIGNLTAQALNNNSCAYVGGKFTADQDVHLNSNSSLQVGTGFIARKLVVNASSLLDILAGGLKLDKDLIMNSNADLRVVGNVSINDNFTLEEGATLTINGNLSINGNFTFRGKIKVIGNSTITINGNVTKGNNRSITGTYTSNKSL